MSRQPSQKDKTQRAFRTYLDLIDTATWLKREMRAPLDFFDLTFEGFRVLEMLYREGALTVPDVGRRTNHKRQNMHIILRRLEEPGWVRQMEVRVPPVEFERSHLPKAKKDEQEGRMVHVVGLTARGKKFIGNVLPRHAKVVKALMRVLDAREHDSISRACRKLRSPEAVFKFLQEIRMVDEDQEAADVREEAAAELERLTARMRVRGRALRIRR
ncbi:MAG: MarR family winged helix-turn-helix transcriptional regulator [Candidatus Acidiferrales bacterium]